MITRMGNLERNMNELKKLKNTIRERREAYTSFNSRIDQAKERISEERIPDRKEQPVPAIPKSH